MIRLSTSKNLNSHDETKASEVDKVRRSESGMIVAPATIEPQQLISDTLEVMRR
jgi:IMP dehydrogenase